MLLDFMYILHGTLIAGMVSELLKFATSFHVFLQVELNGVVVPELLGNVCYFFMYFLKGELNADIVLEAL